MMRWLLAVLLLLNVGFYMWGNWYKDAAVPQQPSVRVDVNPKQMRLISDPAVKPELRRLRKPSSVRTLQPIKHVCHAVGAFSSNRDAMHAGTRLKKAGLEYSLRTQEFTEVSWQVYVPPQKNRAAARAMQTRLNRLGFRDNIILLEKGLNNAVSVGWFKIKANALQQQRALGSKGIKTRRRTIRRTSRRFWLDVPTDKKTLAVLKRIKWKQAGISLRQSTCTYLPANSTAAKPK